MEQSLQSAIDGLIDLLPRLNKDCRDLSQLLYFELAKGKAVTLQHLKSISGYSDARLITLLSQLNYLQYNDDRSIVAYRGITLTPTQYRIEIDFLTEKTIVFAWCAFDSLFLADLLKQDITVFAECPSCHQAINLALANKKTFDSTKYPLYMSFILPSRDNYNEDLANSFCGNIHFFCNEICVENAPHKFTDNQFFSISDALKIAKQRNRTYLSS